MIKKLQKPEDVLGLPKGRLIVGCIEASFPAEDVLAAAQHLIRLGKGENIVTQADVIVQAGQYSWGEGDVYSTIAGNDDAPIPDTHILDLESPEDALRLPEGGIALGVFQATFSHNDVLEAAAILIQNNDAKQLVSQAGVLERAGNKHGFGAGEGYRLI